MIKWLAYIINIVWIKKTIPDDWRRGIILPFWKNKGNKEVCSNHRGITLLSIPGKLFAMILLERIRPTFHNHRRSEQAGFTAGRSTTEQIFAIRQIIEKSKEFNKSTYIAFIDFKAAFDSVSRDSLWKIQCCVLYTKVTWGRGNPKPELELSCTGKACQRTSKTKSLNVQCA